MSHSMRHRSVKSIATDHDDNADTDSDPDEAETQFYAETVDSLPEKRSRMRPGPTLSRMLMRFAYFMGRIFNPLVMCVCLMALLASCIALAIVRGGKQGWTSEGGRMIPLISETVNYALSERLFIVCGIIAFLYVSGSSLLLAKLNRCEERVFKRCIVCLDKDEKSWYLVDMLLKQQLDNDPHETLLASAATTAALAFPRTPESAKANSDLMIAMGAIDKIDSDKQANDTVRRYKRFFYALRKQHATTKSWATAILFLAGCAFLGTTLFDLKAYGLAMHGFFACQFFVLWYLFAIVWTISDRSGVSLFTSCAKVDAWFAQFMQCISEQPPSLSPLHKVLENDGVAVLGEFCRSGESCKSTDELMGMPPMELLTPRASIAIASPAMRSTSVPTTLDVGGMAKRVMKDLHRNIKVSAEGFDNLLHELDSYESGATTSNRKTEAQEQLEQSQQAAYKTSMVYANRRRSAALTDVTKQVEDYFGPVIQDHHMKLSDLMKLDTIRLDDDGISDPDGSGLEDFSVYDATTDRYSDTSSIGDPQKKEIGTNWVTVAVRRPSDAKSPAMTVASVTTTSEIMSDYLLQYARKRLRTFYIRLVLCVMLLLTSPVVGWAIGYAVARSHAFSTLNTMDRVWDVTTLFQYINVGFILLFGSTLTFDMMYYKHLILLRRISTIARTSRVKFMTDTESTHRTW